MKTLLATLALVAAGTAASANTLYGCERQTLPILGFTNKAAAESWYPENIWFVIDAQDEWADGTYGDDTGIYTNWIHFGEVRVELGTKRNKNKVWVSPVPKPGYKTAAAASYECTTSYTSWESY